MIITDRNEYAEECEWIESTGGQWIDLGLHATPRTRLVLDYELTNMYPLQQRFFGTNVQTSTVGEFCFTVYLSGVSSIAYGCQDDIGNWTSLTNVNGDCKRHTIDLDSYNSTCTFDGYTENITSTRTHISSVNMQLFAAGNPFNNAYNTKSQMRVYSCQVYESGVKKLDLVPVKLADGNGAMYDKLSTKLFINMGAGNFKAGTDTFTKLDYIESTGQEYIDTGYYANQNTYLYVGARPLDISETRSLFSCRNSYQVSDFSIIWNKTGIYSSYDSTGVTYTTPALVANTDYDMTKARNMFICNRAVNTINDRDNFYPTNTGKIFASETGTNPRTKQVVLFKNI